MMKHDQLTNKNGSYANSSPQTKDSNFIKNVDLQDTKPTKDMTIIKETGSNLQQNIALETPKTIESLTQTETEAGKNTLVSKGHRLYIDDFEDLKRVETVNLKFLRLLNYDLTDTIYARVIEKRTKEEKEQGVKPCPPENVSGNLGDILPKLKDSNENKNQNVYFVVNGGGQKAKDVKVGRALMLEIDKDDQGRLIPIDEQYQIMIDKFGIPTIAIFTGNKSLHCYYTYSEPIDTNLWQQMQEDALAYCPITDQSIKDLPRILRLVGFKHSETGKYSEVYAESGIEYSYDELRSRIPERPVETKKKKPVAKAQKARKATGTGVTVPNTASKEPCPPSNEDVKHIIEAGTDKDGLLIVQNIKNHKSIEFDADDYVEILPLESLVRLLEIKTALEVLDTDICDDYDTWLNIGMALHHECSANNILDLDLDFFEAMRALFHAWSRDSDKYDEVETEAKWDSFSSRDNSIKINTLFYHAHQKTDNVKRLARNIYPLIDSYYATLKLDPKPSIDNLISEKPHPPFDEYGDLIYVKNERQDLILTDSLDSLNYEDLCELLKVKTALELLTEDDVTNYDTWTRVIRAVKSVILEYPELDLHLRNLVDTWSATAANYDPQAFIDKWESLTADVGISIVDLFTLAQRALDNEPGNLVFCNIFDDKYPWCYKNKHATEQKHEESVPKWKKYGVAISTKVKSYFDEEIINKGAKYNLHTENIEMGDRKFSLEELFFHICEELNSNIPDNIFRKCIDLFLSDESKQFHPFDDYIRSLAPASNKVITEERIEWAKSVISEKLMQEVLSLDATDDRFDIYQDLITTWLAGFTDRSLNPGCKFDHVLVLYGSQSIGKTTFFQSLVSPDYFLSHAGSVTDKDSKMAFGRNKLIEMGEISSTFRKSDQETLKNYITTQIDQYRVPYSAKVQSFPRRFALCASTNDEHFLSDATGNRRYFVIPVEQRINVDKVPEILDDLYTAVQVLMQAGVARSYLSPIQLERLNKVNRDYTDLYEGDLLEEILNGNKGYRDFDPNSFSINDLLRVIHEYHPHASRNPIKQKLAATIKAMGYTNKRVRIDGSQKRVWVRDTIEQTMEDNQDKQVDTTIDETNAEYLSMKQDLIKYHSDKGNDSIAQAYQKHPFFNSKDKKKIKRAWDRLQSELNIKY